MDLFTVILLGILQGIVEWLPISSEGQIVPVTVTFLDLTLEEALALAFFLHLGTMAVVLVRFRTDFEKMAKGDQELIKLLFLATIGTAITALPCYFFLEEFWERLEAEFSFSPGDFITILVGVFLIITGVVLHYQREEGLRLLSSLTDKEILILGMAQGLAVLPGISRSGMTISVLLYLSLRQTDALRGSFLISVPAVCGALTLEIITGNIISLELHLIIVTLLVTFISGYISMEILLRAGKNFPFDRFCIILGIIAIIIGILGLTYVFIQ